MVDRIVKNRFKQPETVPEQLQELFALYARALMDTVKPKPNVGSGQETTRDIHDRLRESRNPVVSPTYQQTTDIGGPSPRVRYPFFPQRSIREVD